MTTARDPDSTGSPLRSFEQSLPMALLRAREASMRLFRPLLASHDLTEQQWRVLRALAAAGEPMLVGEIATQTFLLAPSLTRILSNLERRDLVARRTVAEDQRRAAISLTDAGRHLFDRIAPRSEATYGDIEAAFGADRLASLLAELDALRQTTQSCQARKCRVDEMTESCQARKCRVGGAA